MEFVDRDGQRSASSREGHRRRVFAIPGFCATNVTILARASQWSRASARFFRDTLSIDTICLIVENCPDFVG
jgi:hypothetical protein